VYHPFEERLVGEKNPTRKNGPSKLRASIWGTRDSRQVGGACGAVYSLDVQKNSGAQAGPARGLYLGLVVTILAVLLYAGYITVQFAGVRKLQSEMVDRNRKDSLQLLRIQNDLNSLGLAMRDMLDAGEPYPLAAFSAQFDRIRTDLTDAMKQEEPLAEATPTSEQRRYLSQALSQFWDASDRMFALANAGQEDAAREQIRDTLQPRQAALTSAVSRLLVQNNEAEENATERISTIYNRVQRQLYIFLAVILLAIAMTSLYLIANNRRLFARTEELSSQRSELAQKLISTQELTLRHISRELHDEFGQVLTAIGSLLKRTGKHVPEDSPLHEDLQEVREIAQTTLNNIRGLSQALHPVLLEEAGLESTLDWYIPTVERQTGVALHYEKSGESFSIETAAGVQIYRVLQEALNNVSRHSAAKEAWIRLRFQPERLELDVEDHGKGFAPVDGQTGIGLVAMRERAEILGGTLSVSLLNGTQAAGATGTVVKLRIPRARVEPHGE
jgi:signal transduction histidine kinase